MVKIERSVLVSRVYKCEVGEKEGGKIHFCFRSYGDDDPGIITIDRTLQLCGDLTSIGLELSLSDAQAVAYKLLEIIDATKQVAVDAAREGK